MESNGNAQPQDVEEQKIIVINDDVIREAISNPKVIAFVKQKVPRLPRTGAQQLIKDLLVQNVNIPITALSKKNAGLLLNNMGKFETDEKTKITKMKIEAIKILRDSLLFFLLQLGKDIQICEPSKIKNTNIKKIEENIYLVDNNTMYDKLRKLICNEGGDVILKYDFDNADLPITIPENSVNLQRCLIQIKGCNAIINYPIEYFYCCYRCQTKRNLKAYEVASTKTKIMCDGLYNSIDGNGKPKTSRCGISLAPDSTLTITKDIFYYDITYDDEKGEKISISAMCFNNLNPGFYEVVMFSVEGTREIKIFHIVDTKPMKDNVFVLPEQKEEENYLFTLQRACDEYIYNQTKMNIWGLYPVKVAMLIQCIASVLNTLMTNVQIIGDSSTGKSTVLKYYGFLINNQLNLSTNGLSISIAALRGTRVNIPVMGKEIKVITPGYLGTFKTIHIDEAGENRELIQNLKTFLLEENYSYDKAGATGAFNKRRAQVNISENVNFNHTGQYRGSIKKAYREINYKIGEEEQVEWDETWDLHLPLYEYTNTYLRKVIKDKRDEFRQKQVWWVDGYEIPLHERFLFYFYLVNEKENERLKEIIQINTGKDLIKENLELIRVLKNNELPAYFESLKQYVEGENDRVGFEDVNRILDKYDMHLDVRMQSYYYKLLMFSRIANKRKHITQQDYDLVRWFLETTNCKIDVADTDNYNIKQSPNILVEKEKDLKIEDEIHSSQDVFTLPSDEFT